MAERPLPTVIGPTENALRALLAHTLRTTPISGYRQWVVMTMTFASAPRDAMAKALHASTSDVAGVIDDLTEAGLLAPDGRSLTGAGEEALHAARALVGAATGALIADIPDAEAEVTRRVLDTVRARAEAALTLG